MANPASAASQEDLNEGIENDKTDDKQPTVEEKINSIVDNITRDEKGQYVLPDDLSETEKFAAIAEKRRRDTQSSFTKTAQEAKALKAEKAALLLKVSSAVTVELTKEQAEELEELKFSDPEAWRKKVNRYEREAAHTQQETIDKELKQVSASSLEKEELERRADVLLEFNQAHPDFELSDDTIANDIPPRIVKRLETGVISFEAFLQECYDYTKTGKVIKQDKPLTKQPNLSRVGGGSKPDDNAIKEDIILSYKKEVF
jgi:hypothetical protein